MLFWARIFFASFDLPLQWIIWDSPKIGSNNLKRMEDWISNFLKDHLPADLFVQFKNSSCLHFEQEKQLYRLYHTPSFSGSRRKQKHFLVPLTLSLCPQLRLRLLNRRNNLSKRNYEIITFHNPKYMQSCKMKWNLAKNVCNFAQHHNYIFIQK